MNAIITTTLSYFNMSGINTNFFELERELGVDRHTLKKHYDAGAFFKKVSNINYKRNQIKIINYAKVISTKFY